MFTFTKIFSPVLPNLSCQISESVYHCPNRPKIPPENICFEEHLWTTAFVYANSCQNKLNVNKKENKNWLQFTFEKRILCQHNSGTWAITTKLFPKKWHLYNEINFNSNSKKEFCFCFFVTEKNLYFGMKTFQVNGENCIMKNENCIVFPESYLDSYPDLEFFPKREYSIIMHYMGQHS